MALEFHDIVGLIGAGCILISYFLLQTEKMSPHGFAYSALNLAGALFILFSLFYAWNLTAFFIEIIWSGISIWGLLKWFASPRQREE